MSTEETAQNSSSQAYQWVSTFALLSFGCTLLGSTLMWSWSGGADIAELTMCGTVGGVPHAPGYPLWTNLAWLATEFIPAAHPAGRIAVMAAGLAVASALCTRGLIQRLGGGAWLSTVIACVVLTIPICIRAFSVPDVYSLDLLLLSASALAVFRGHGKTPDKWTGVGLLLAVLAVGHRPQNVLFFVALMSTLDRKYLGTRPVIGGLVVGLLVQAGLYADLWTRIHEPSTPWVAMGAVPGWLGFAKFVTGLDVARFLDAPSLGGLLSKVGLQAAVVSAMAFVAPLIIRPKRVGWAVFGYAVAQLIFACVYQISDAGFSFIPLIWCGVVVLGVAATQYTRGRDAQVSLVALMGLCVLAMNNRAVMDKQVHEQWAKDLSAVLDSMPPDSVVISSDWSVRAGLVSMQKVDGQRSDVDVVRLEPNGEGAAVFASWFHHGDPIWQTEERQELTERRTVRIVDERLLRPIEDQGFLAHPAEPGAWSVESIDDGPVDFDEAGQDTGSAE